MVAADFTIGNTRIRIADDYCMKTRKEVEAALARMSERAERKRGAVTGDHDR